MLRLKSVFRNLKSVICTLSSVLCLFILPCAAVAGTATVMIGWDPSPDPLAGYEFCYGTSSGNYDFTVDVGNATSCSISGLEEGTTYYFAAKAYDAAGVKSEFSGELIYKIPASVAKNDQIWIEAEDGILYPPMQEDWSADASSGGYISVPKGYGNLYKISNENGSAEYTFEVMQAGTYQFWGRVVSANLAEDSFFVSIDGRAYIEWHTQVGGTGTWIWDQLRDGPVNEGRILQLDLEAGQHTLAVTQREDGTRLDKMLLTNDPEYVPQGMGEGPVETVQDQDEPEENIDPADFKLWIEAESGDLRYPFEFAWDSKASSGQYAWVPNDRGSSWDPKDNSGYIEYHFDVPAAGDFVVWGRVLARNGKDNSFYVSIDDGAYALWDTKRSKSWVWDQVSHRKGDDPVIYHLNTGPHTLTIKQREDGTKLDEILITDDLTYVPE